MRGVKSLQWGSKYKNYDEINGLLSIKHTKGNHLRGDLMDYEKEIEELKRRLTIVENNLNAFIKTYNMDKSYNKADNNGIRQSVSNITPYTESKKAYIGDKEIAFNYMGDGHLSVYVMDSEGNIPAYSIKRTQDLIVVIFDEPLEVVTEVTISIV